jgi:hypothetical protein
MQKTDYRVPLKTVVETDQPPKSKFCGKVIKNPHINRYDSFKVEAKGRQDY